MKVYAVHRINGHRIQYNYAIWSTKELAELCLKKLMDNYHKDVKPTNKNYNPNWVWIEEEEILENESLRYP